jgi:hypothetical protein
MRFVSALAMVVLLAAAAGCTGNIVGDDDDDPMGSDGGAAGIDASQNASIDAAVDDTIDAGPQNQGEPAGLVGITNLHNEVRATVGVPPLTWDDDLAAIAQGWGDSCTDNENPIGLVDHNPGRSDNYPGYVGENIYGSGGSATPAGAVGLWAAEEANYDYDSNTCSGVCGHYTQIVWSTTERVGCGLSNCQGLQYGSTIVCNYSPGGNNGNRPY